MKIFHEILAITLALTIAAYASAAALTAQPGPVNPDRTHVITSLAATGNLGSKAVFGLLTLNLISLTIDRNRD
jgi:hypothetical protein